MRLKLTLAYVGTAYSGWQRQPSAPTIQGEVEAAVRAIAGEAVGVTGASRTDAGVHAEGQVAHADLPDRLEAGAWQSALNAHLPPDIRVLDAGEAELDFHARFGATRKRYRYRIDERSVASPFDAPFAWHVAGELDLDAMRRGAEGLLHERLDQRAFATQPEDAERPRPLEAIEIERDALLTVSVTGRSFLRYAVRGMVGTLVEVGRGRRAPETVGQLALDGDRAAAGATAPAHGLCLVAVDYDTS